MKTILLLFIISLSLLAGTTYKSPEFVIENSPLFCTDYSGSPITTKPVGDIITGEYAADYCGFTEEIAKVKQETYARLKQQRDNDPISTILGWVIGIMLLFSAFIIVIGIVS